jgi:hypothetical protein
MDEALCIPTFSIWRKEEEPAKERKSDKWGRRKTERMECLIN